MGLGSPDACGFGAGVGRAGGQPSNPLRDRPLLAFAVLRKAKVVRSRSAIYLDARCGATCPPNLGFGRPALCPISKDTGPRSPCLWRPRGLSFETVETHHTAKPFRAQLAPPDFSGSRRGASDARRLLGGPNAHRFSTFRRNGRVLAAPGNRPARSLTWLGIAQVDAPAKLRK